MSMLTAVFPMWARLLFIVAVIGVVWGLGFAKGDDYRGNKDQEIISRLSADKATAQGNEARCSVAIKAQNAAVDALQAQCQQEDAATTKAVALLLRKLDAPLPPGHGPQWANDRLREIFNAP